MYELQGIHLGQNSQEKAALVMFREVVESVRMEKVNRPYIIGGAIIMFAISVFVAIYISGIISHTTDKSLLGIALPTAVATASLLVTLHNRSTNIADRIRALSKEITDIGFQDIARSSSDSRVQSVMSQIDLFADRFSLSVASIFSALFCLLSLLPLTISLFPGTEAVISYTSVKLAELLVFFFCFGALTALVDIVMSLVTLNAEKEYAIERATYLSARQLGISAKNTDTVIHFNRLFHKIWFVDRVALLNSQADERVSHAFFHRYFGMHHEEFHFFLNGLLPKAIYMQWILCARLNATSTQEDANKVKTTGPVVVGLANFRSGWDVFCLTAHDTVFVEFMEKVLFEQDSLESLIFNAETQQRLLLAGGKPVP